MPGPPSSWTNYSISNASSRRSLSMSRTKFSGGCGLQKTGSFSRMRNVMRQLVPMCCVMLIRFGRMSPDMAADASALIVTKISPVNATPS